MPPFSKSMCAVRLKSSNIVSEEDSKWKLVKREPEFVLEAWVDEDWMVAVVPNGGYLIALVLQACSIVQSETNQKEPLYLSAQYLGSSTSGPCIITVKRIRAGRIHCNMVATLAQHGRTNIHCQVIYGTLQVANHPFGSFQASPDLLTLAHPDALSRRCPLATHPSKCTISPFRRPLNFARHMIQAIDPYYIALLEKRGDVASATSPVDLGGGGTAWGGWYQLLDKEDNITAHMLPFLGDVVPELLPDSLAMQREAMWFPTLALAVDYKYRVPSSTNLPVGIAPRTVGVFATMRLLIGGRFEPTIEIWTAPCEIGMGIEEEGWQDKMYCMASVTQSAMTVPASVNFKKTKGKGKEISSKL